VLRKLQGRRSVRKVTSKLEHNIEIKFGYMVYESVDRVTLTRDRVSEIR